MKSKIVPYSGNHITFLSYIQMERCKVHWSIDNRCYSDVCNKVKDILFRDMGSFMRAAADEIKERYK